MKLIYYGLLILTLMLTLILLLILNLILILTVMKKEDVGEIVTHLHWEVQVSSEQKVYGCHPFNLDTFYIELNKKEDVRVFIL